MSKTMDDRTELLLRCMAYEPETGAFTYLVNSGSRSAGDVAASVCRLGYARFKIGGHTIAGHRAAFVFMLGRWPTHFVDHINGVRSDNRWVNLREATPAGNSQNRPVQWNSTSGIRGVRCRPGQSKTKPWEARIKVGGRFIGKDMRNRFAGKCYRCGEIVEPGTGFFEKTDPKRAARLGLSTTSKFLTQHKECSVKWYGTTHTYLKQKEATEAK